ncbi:phosphoglucosamine mutase [Rubritalea spongiae]|uniref:Phosphoglucosamine mutase n=1 Tax=Rubritalea spongiae TaxID=430797 RepID=A0ABW5E4G8_9BACT
MSKQLFGTDGIRGKANQWPITPEVAMRVGRAVARVMPAKLTGKHKVVVGRDTRQSGGMLESAIVAGLISEGAEVLLTGPIPTPAVAYLTKSMDCDAGIMLTASHNPYRDNGIKIFGADGFKLDDELELAVEEVILAEKLPDPDGELGKVVELEDASNQYCEYAKLSIGRESLEGLKVVIDCAHGAGFRVGPEVLKGLGAEVLVVGDQPDGLNINEGVGALHPQSAAELVKLNDADVGVCLDGDADRVIFVNENGEVVSGDKMMCLCAKALKKQGKLKNDTLVATVMSNLGMKAALEEVGISVETTGVGDRLVIERMREGGFSLGGENSGHIIFADSATTGDGIMSALKVLQMLKDTGMPLSELADGMFEFPQELSAIEVAEKPAIDSVPALKQVIAEQESELGNDGRVLVRYSGTENKIRVLVEAKDATMAKAASDAICEVVEATIGTQAAV